MKGAAVCRLAPSCPQSSASTLSSMLGSVIEILNNNGKKETKFESFGYNLGYAHALQPERCVLCGTEV